MLFAEKQICIYFKDCPFHNGTYSGPCSGADPSREKIFYCDLIDKNGNYSSHGFRNKFDETGKMQILLENSKLE